MASSRGKYLLGCQIAHATNHQQSAVPFFSSSLLISVSLAKVSCSSWGKILNDSDEHSWGTWLIHLMKHKLLCFWNKSAAGLNKGCSLRTGSWSTGCEMHCWGDSSWPWAGLTLTHGDKNASKPFQSCSNLCWKTILECISPRNVYYLLITHRYCHTDKLCTL